MKKFAAIVLALLIIIGVLIVLTSFADEIQTITIDDNSEKSFNVVKLNTPIEISDFAKVTFTSFEYIDELDYQDEWNDGVNYGDATYISGANAECAMLRTDVVNITNNAEDYAKLFTLKVIYKDKYVYEGSVNQYNYDDTDKCVKKNGISAEIDPFYEGHYALWAYLPNAIVNDKTGSLKMIIKLGDYEITYIVQK